MEENIELVESLHKSISVILLKEWDPIGVQDISEAFDEYDGYVAPLYKMLIDKKSLQDIFEYLVWAESEHMGLSTVDRQHTHLVAQRLRDLSN
ncbi:hypothetical protein [Acinetobacter sp. BSP-28]|uniref:hypothetical protein n=1 Tax=Acinetobacter sp. BSP-28 TaxID=3344661 RepID=UPI00376F821C